MDFLILYDRLRSHPLMEETVFEMDYLSQDSIVQHYWSSIDLQESRKM